MTEHKQITKVRRAGLEFNVHDAGPADGDVVVLLHGFPETAHSWRLVAPQLHAAGYRTVAMDQRGYSPGARPSRRRDYRVRELVADALALVDEAVGASGRVHVVGHDWGAIVAWGLAQQHPDRVASLTAVSVPHPGAFFASFVRSSQALKSWYMLAFQVPKLAERVSGPGQLLEKQLRATGMTADDVKRVRAEIIDSGALTGALNWYRALTLNNPRDLLRRVAVPTSMVWSDGDTALGRNGAESTERWVDGTYHFVELSGISHWIPTQAPDALAEAILDRVGSSPVTS